MSEGGSDRSPPPPPLPLLCQSVLDDVAHELDVVGGAADRGRHPGLQEGPDGREVRGRRHAVLGVGRTRSARSVIQT